MRHRFGLVDFTHRKVDPPEAREALAFINDGGRINSFVTSWPDMPMGVCPDCGECCILLDAGKIPLREYAAYACRLAGLVKTKQRDNLLMFESSFQFWQEAAVRDCLRPS